MKYINLVETLIELKEDYEFGYWDQIEEFYQKNINEIKEEISRLTNKSYNELSITFRLMTNEILHK